MGKTHPGANNRSHQQWRTQGVNAWEGNSNFTVWLSQGTDSQCSGLGLVQANLAMPSSNSEPEPELVGEGPTPCSNAVLR